ncbi:hypothetical protein AB0A73_21550 [Glycomyces sp. NPDC047369]
MNPDGSDSDIGSYAIMAEWDGCTALDDIASVEAFMGITAWGTNGLLSTDIPGGMDGEAFNCTAYVATLPAYEHRSDVTGDRTFAGQANVDVGVAPWDSDAEASENFTERVEQLDWALDSGGTEYANVLNGEFPVASASNWDETYYHGGNSSTSYVLSVIARQGDVVLYVFADYTDDPAVMMRADPVYPFTDASFTAWIIGDYLPAVYEHVMALKAEGAQAGVAAE